MKSGALRMTPQQVVEHYNSKLGFVPVDALDQIVAPSAPKKANGKLRRSRQPNKTEAEFGRMLEARRLKGEFVTVEFESVRLKVGDGCYYTPDYLCQTAF